MARKQSEFYRGQKQKKNLAIIPFVAVLLFFAIAIVTFYSMQKYAVLSDEGVSIQLPILTGTSGGGSASLTKRSDVDKYYAKVDAGLSLNAADYSSVKAVAGKDLDGIRAIYIPYEEVLDTTKIDEYVARLSKGNALLFELKKENGYLAYYSDTTTVANYNLNMAAPESKQQLTSIISNIKQYGDVYLVAQISCCIDDLFASHCDTIGLRTQYGLYYNDEKGYYLDPYNQIVRDYAVELVRELWDMGFDEVVLQNVLHPVIEIDGDGDTSNDIEIVYTREMTTTPTKGGAVCGFAINVAEQLEDRPEGKVLSIYINRPKALVKTDPENGQNGQLFLKVYDRVYYQTDMYAYQFNVSDILPGVEVGIVYDRLVPVVINNLPDNTSWVLIDQEDD